ncbi:MAG TPA: SH3 domain-containing protein [Spirochaetota bacterium]|nr:SH3 domain-containing protein [Spirochaetota bacterium]HOM37885.1 SH3 domain-containing protein [Spirochaetota bacterium]HPQ48689.1 SH3 domain-containing protein [Spirochaetota bacterium]
MYSNKNFILKFLLFSFFILSCKTVKEITKEEDIEDLKKIPQNALFFADKSNVKLLILPEFNNMLIQYYFKKYFEVWNNNYIIPNLKEYYENFFKEEYYGENKQKIEQDFIEKIIKNSDINNYPSLSSEGITVKTTELRVIPTHKPFFKDFNKAGEGYPFDYAQSYIINGNTPLKILHMTEDKEWAFVIGIFGQGWVKTNDIAFVNKDIINKIVTHKEWIVIIRDDVTIKLEEKNLFLYKVNIGAIFPLIKEKETNFVVKVIVSNEYREGVEKEVLIPKNVSNRGFMELKKGNIAKIINNMIGKPYSWGGLYGNRDCSGLVKDLFSVFGIYFPRFSYHQFQTGIYFTIDNLPLELKEEIIKKNGFPFFTLIWMPGHIAIYIGEFENKIVIFHSLWGIKTIKDDNTESRKIIGKAVITTLEPGKENNNIKSTILSRVSGISNIIPPLYIQQMIIRSNLIIQQ